MAWIGYLTFSFFFLLGLVCLPASKLLCGDHLSPFGVYGFVWFFMIAVSNLCWVKYVYIEGLTWMICGLSLAGFLVSYSIVALVRKPKTKIGHYSGRDLDAFRLNALIVFLFIVGLAGTLHYLKAIGEMFGLASLINDRAAIRIGQGSEEFQSAYGIGRFFYYSNGLLIVLAVVYMRFFGIKRFHLFLTAAAFGQLLLSMDRTMPYFAIIWAFFAWWYATPATKGLAKRLGIAALVIAGLFFVFVGVASSLGKRAVYHPQMSPYILLDERFAWLADPYIYLTANVPGFQEYMRSNYGGETLGKFSLLPLIKVLAVFAPEIEVPSEVGEFEMIPFPFNAYTYLNVYYKDFGLLGCIVLPCMLGAASALVYCGYREKPTFGSFFLLSLMSYCLVFSIFTNRFVTTYVWQSALLVLAIGRWVSPNREREPIERGSRK